MRSPLALARRIAVMSFDEARTRVRMAVRRRWDVLQARHGKNPLQTRFVSPRARPRFYFDEGEIALLAEEVRCRLPADYEATIETAKRIQKGRFDLLGYCNLSFGESDIHWHRDPVHQIDTPLKPWFRIPYLDFERVGDHKIVWELSRHQYLTLLARAWLYSGDVSFLVTLEDLWFSWRQNNPYPIGINWASTLEVAFRCLSWIWVDHLTAGAEVSSRAFRQTLRAAIGECAVYVERYLSTYFAPNTHLLGEALALLYVGVLYPTFERALIWRDFGWKMILQESWRQVRDDGVHFEQSVYYHVYALDMLLHARILAARNDLAIPESYDRTLKLMAEVLATIGAAGEVPRFGDDDGGRLFDGRRNRTEHMLDPLATAAILYGRADWKAAAGLREETIWLLGAAGIRGFDQLPTTSFKPRSQAFVASGYYTLASSDAIVIVDAGPHGWGNGGHGHADALSLQLISRGEPWLTDPGTAAYPTRTPERDLFRSTAAHNTLEVDGRSQAEPVHAFAWGRHPLSKVHVWQKGEYVTLFKASHDGYERLPSPVTHERWVIGWRDAVWLVADSAGGEGIHRLDLRWHLSPDCTPLPTSSGNFWRYTANNETLDIIVPSGSRWNVDCEIGKWSPAYGAIVSAPLLHFFSEGPLPADFLTLLALNQREPVSFCSVSADRAEICLYRLGQLQRIVALAKSPGTWQIGPIECSAALLLLEYSDSQLRHLLLSGSSELRVGGERPVLTNTAACLWEGIARDGTPFLNKASATTLLQVFERLLAGAPASVASARQESGCIP